MYLRKRVLITTLLNLLTYTYCFSQIGGQNVYELLSLTNSARIAALGGNQISIKDNDLNFVLANPSLLTSDMDNKIVTNYVHYFSAINYLNVSYAKNIEGFGTVAAGLNTLNYGKFIEADEAGNIIGQFFASDYCLNLFWSKAINDYFSVGANVKPVFSTRSHYKSFGLLSDVGITYNNTKKLFTAAAVIKNIGSEIKPYIPGNYETIVPDVQIGVTKKLSHAPFRISILAQHLQKFDLTYTNSNITIIDSAVVKKNKIKDIADKAMRHIIIGVEFIPSKNFSVNLGFNYQRRKELVVDTRPYITAFSAGFSIKISKFNFSYARSQYHLAGASNTFSIGTNLSDFYTKNK